MSKKLKLVQHSLKKDNSNKGENISKYFALKNECDGKKLNFNTRSRKLKSLISDQNLNEDINEFGDREIYSKLNDTSDIKVPSQDNDRKVHKKQNHIRNLKSRKRKITIDRKQPKIKNVTKKINSAYDDELTIINDQMGSDDLNAENFQLAIALSISTNNCNDIHPLHNTQERMQTIKQTLEQFGFKTSKASNTEKRIKCSKFVLVQRGNEERKQVIESNIDRILKAKKHLNLHADKNVPLTIVSDTLLGRLSRDSYLYKKCVNCGTSEPLGSNMVQPVSLLKNWNDIPGRDFEQSQIQKKQITVKINSPTDDIVLLNKIEGNHQNHDKLKVFKSPVKLNVKKNVILNTNIRDKSYVSNYIEEKNISISCKTPISDRSFMVVHDEESTDLNDKMKVLHENKYCKSPDLFSDNDSSGSAILSKEIIEEDKNLKSNTFFIANDIVYTVDEDCSTDSSNNSMDIRANGFVFGNTTKYHSIFSNYIFNRFFEDFQKFGVSQSYSNNTKTDYSYNSSYEPHDASSNENQKIKQNNFIVKDSFCSTSQFQNLKENSLDGNLNEFHNNNSMDVKVVISEKEKSLCDEISLFPTSELNKVIGCHNIFKKSNNSSIEAKSNLNNSSICKNESNSFVNSKTYIPLVRLQRLSQDILTSENKSILIKHNDFKSDVCNINLDQDKSQLERNECISDNDYTSNKDFNISVENKKPDSKIYTQENISICDGSICFNSIDFEKSNKVKKLKISNIEKPGKLNQNTSVQTNFDISRSPEHNVNIQKLNVGNINIFHSTPVSTRNGEKYDIESFSIEKNKSLQNSKDTRSTENRRVGKNIDHSLLNKFKGTERNFSPEENKSLQKSKDTRSTGNRSMEKNIDHSLLSKFNGTFSESIFHADTNFFRGQSLDKKITNKNKSLQKSSNSDSSNLNDISDKNESNLSNNVQECEQISKIGDDLCYLSDDSVVLISDEEICCSISSLNGSQNSQNKKIEHKYNFSKSSSTKDTDDGQISNLDINMLSNGESLNKKLKSFELINNSPPEMQTECNRSPEINNSSLSDFEEILPTQNSSNELIGFRNICSPLHQSDKLKECKTFSPTKIITEIERSNEFLSNTTSKPVCLNEDESLYEIKKHNVTPKPDFAKLSVYDRKNMLKKYGLKDLKKKRANQLLEYIYDQTHPIAEITPDQRLKFKADNGKKSTMQCQINTDLHLSVENHSKISCDAALHTSFSKLLQSDKSLMIKILRYDPIDLEYVKSKLKEQGQKFDTKQLKVFLDKKNIAVKTKEKTWKDKKKKPR